MATAEQVKSLIRAHFSDDAERFYSVSLQVAAGEARQGHAGLAHDLREIIDTERKKAGPRLLSFPADLKGLVLTEEPSTPLAAMVLPTTIRNRLDRIIHEYRQQNKLKQHGLVHRRKILLIGPPGTGKTMTAEVLAKELTLPLNTIQVDRLVTKFMGETSAKLRQIFDLMQQAHGVYLFDEFDAIGGDRSNDNDVGEIRRVLNAFLQFIEQDTSDSLIIAATNNPGLLDHALFRRFDDVLHYDRPSSEQMKSLIENVMGTFIAPRFAWKRIVQACDGLSHAEIDHACRDAIKTVVLKDAKQVGAADLLAAIEDRQNARSGRNG